MTEHSPSPGTPQTATKATTAAIVSGILTTIIVAVSTYLEGRDEIDPRGLIVAVLLGLLTAAPTYLATYNATNKRKAGVA